MSPSTLASRNDLDSLLDQLDVADAAVRTVYLKLADDPDLAPHHETTLRELHRKRLDLAHQAGFAALKERTRLRTTLDGSSASAEPLSTASPSVEPEDGPSAEAVVTTLPEIPAVSVATEEEAREVPAPPVEPPITEGPPDEEPEKPPAVPLTPEQLQRFLAAVTTPSPAPKPQARPDDRTLLLMLTAHVGISEKVETLVTFNEEADQIDRATTEERQKRWREMTRDGQAQWLSVLVAWVKALDEDALRLGQHRTVLPAVFRRLRSFSINDSPGFVNGFARNAVPRSMTWREDAVRSLREIRPVPEPVETKPKSKVLAPVVVEDEEPTPGALADWHLLDRVKGLRVVLLGGEPKEERRVALEKAFQFESLEWIPRNRPRLVASLAERSSRGTIDFVLVTKFVAHKETEAIQRANGAPMLTMRHGYGVAAIRQTFEEHFSRQAGATSSPRMADRS